MFARVNSVSGAGGRVEIRPRAAPLPRDLARPELPGSKSHAQRALVLAAGASAGTLLRGVPDADDVAVLVTALRALGAHVETRADGLWVAGGLGPGAQGRADFGANATALRFLLLVVPMLGGSLAADGDPGLRRRPLDEVCDLLAQGGARVSARALPLTADGTGARWPARCSVDGRRTTQPASAALLGMALRVRHGAAASDLVVRAPGAPGYVALTADVLRAFGFEVHVEARSCDLACRFGAEVGAAAAVYDVPRDAAAAAFPGALAALHGFAWEPDLAPGDPHPEAEIALDLARLRDAEPGVEVELAELARRPDAFPALCVVAAARAGVTVLRGAPALRGKESDRIRAMANALSAAGVRCRELPDGLVVQGPLPRHDALCELPAPEDHRVVMALALLGTVSPGGVALPHPRAVAKSWPGYFGWLARLADVRPLERG